MRTYGHMMAVLAATSLVAAAPSTDFPTEGKKKRADKDALKNAAPNGGTVTRQQRRYAERQAMKRLPK